MINDLFLAFASLVQKDLVAHAVAAIDVFDAQSHGQGIDDGVQLALLFDQFLRALAHFLFQSELFIDQGLMNHDLSRDVLGKGSDVARAL